MIIRVSFSDEQLAFFREDDRRQTMLICHSQRFSLPVWVFGPATYSAERIKEIGFEKRWATIWLPLSKDFETQT
jgi:hypothetical protein